MRTKVVNKSVRDCPQTVVLQNGKVTVTNKMGNNVLDEFSFQVQDLPQSSYEQMIFLRNRNRMWQVAPSGLAQRIIDAQHRAVCEAIAKASELSRAS